MKVVKNALAVVFGNTIGQRVLGKVSRYSNWLMGIGSGSYFDGSGEVAIIKRILNDTNEEVVVLDVGANQGQFLGLALSVVGARIKHVHCFEPAAATFKMLSSKYADFPCVKLNNFGMGQEEGRFSLYYDKEGSGMASLTKRDLSFIDIKFEGSEEVNVTTIDEYCWRNEINYIHLLKIDVEGHELDVMRGAKLMLSKGAISYMTFEFGGTNIDTRTYLRDYYTFLKPYGMTIHRITPSGYLHPMVNYMETYEQFTTINYVAFRSK